MHNHFPKSAIMIGLSSDTAQEAAKKARGFFKKVKDATVAGARAAKADWKDN